MRDAYPTRQAPLLKVARYTRIGFPIAHGMPAPPALSTSLNFLARQPLESGCVLPQAKKTPGDKNGIDTLTHN
jgi:hypothetical protein